MAGYAGPIGINASDDVKILVDISISESANFVSGANEAGFHFKNVCFKRDFDSSEVGDFAQAESGHKAKNSDSRLKAVRGVEIGNIFKLGTKFASSMKASFLDQKGSLNPLIMGCYGIGVGRLMASVIEASHDDYGPIWPKNIAPFQILVVSIGGSPEVLKACQKVYQGLLEKGWEVLLDDRDERPGVKFKDADLWGIPARIAISSKTITENKAELKIRGERDFSKISIEEIEEVMVRFFKED